MSLSAKPDLSCDIARVSPRSAMAPEQDAANEQPAEDVTLAGTRVLFIAPQPFYEDRGSPIAVLQVVRAMSELGMQVDLLAFPAGEQVHVENLRIFRYGKSLRIKNVPIGFSMRKVILDFALIRGLRSRLKAERYACVHALEDGIYVALAAGVSGRIPIVYDMASCIPEQLSTHPLFRNRLSQWILRKFERYALRRSAMVSCSVGLKDYIKSAAPDVPIIEWAFSDPDIHTDTKKLDEPARLLRAELGIEPGADVILYAGNFQEYQGVDILVEAFSVLRQTHANAVLVLLGASNDVEVARLRKLGNGAIIVCPRQPHASVGKYMQMAQILVSPRKWGGNLPLKLFEYLAAGKPIVATDNEHHRLVLNEERAVFADTTPQGLADAISKLLDDPDKMKRLATAAKAHSHSELGWARFVDTVSELYKAILRRRAG